MIELLAIHASACLCNVATHIPGQAPSSCWEYNGLFLLGQVLSVYNKIALFVNNNQPMLRNNMADTDYWQNSQ